jgi:type I restriction enzyme M protein
MERYYTPPSVAKMMVELIPSSHPKTAVDICVGSWNLLSATKNKWQEINLFGVDIDSRSKKLSDGNSFICMDGRAFALDRLKKNAKFSLVLANPPFGKDVMEHVNLFNTLPGYNQMTSVALRRMETTMLLANLSLLEEEGVLAVIVPRTVVDGEWSRCLREYISNNYQLRCIVNLPRRVFGDEVYTTILVIENSKTTSITNIYDTLLTDKKYQLCYKHSLPYQMVRDGPWKLCVPSDSKKECIRIKRGSISNDILENTGHRPVIHSTDIWNLRNGQWKPTKFMPSSLESKVTHNTVEEGYIVAIRVGRNSGLAARIGFKSQIPASNCLLIINTESKKQQDRIWRIMNSSLYYKDLSGLRRGVGACYLTSETLKDYLEAQIGQGGVE